MPILDATAKTAVASHFAPAWFVYLDFLADPLRATTFGTDITFAATGDVDLDTKTYLAWQGAALDISDVSNSDGGSESLVVTLSGIASIDATLLGLIGDYTKWQGRPARLWFHIYDETGTTTQGAIVPFYTGYMSSVRIVAAPSGQTIQLTMENWLAAFNQPSNRSYMNQKDYDAADVSAAATLAAANGLQREGGASSGGASGNACVSIDSLILMADGSDCRAGDIKVGMLVWTRCEDSLSWGAFRVEAVTFVREEIVSRSGWPDATPRHRFLRRLPLWFLRLLPADRRWFRAERHGKPTGSAMVAKITVAGAKTYAARHPDGLWCVSHNVKPIDGLSDPMGDPNMLGSVFGWQ